MRTHLAIPFALAATLAALPAQNSHFYCVLLLRHGAGDLVLNKPLLDALLDEPTLEARLRELTNDRGHPITVRSGLPAPHLPGTFQIHLEGHLVAQEWNDGKAQQAVDRVVAHLNERLAFLLYEQPHAELEARARELRQRCAELGARRVRREQGRDAANARIADLGEQRRELDRQLLAAHIDATTEERAVEQLERLVAEHRARRDDGAAVLAGLVSQSDQLTQRLQTVQGRLAQLEAAKEPSGDEAASLAKQVEELRDRLQAVEARRQKNDLTSQDAQRLLTATLEQLPLATVARQRARAREASIEEQRARLAAELERARAERAEVLADAGGLEQDTIDLTVHRSLLTEVQGKLARLEPVRIELLRK